MLYYSSPQIVLQEVPNEISLALSISGCPLRCQGCHSAYTRDPTYGKPLDVVELDKELRKNPHVSCVLFYGGEWRQNDLSVLLRHIKTTTDLKTCLYTGRRLEAVPKSLFPLLDFIKVGEYVESLGGLGSPTTNQVFYSIQEGEFTEIKFT